MEGKETFKKSQKKVEDVMVECFFTSPYPLQGEGRGDEVLQQFSNFHYSFQNKRQILKYLFIPESDNSQSRLLYLISSVFLFLLKRRFIMHTSIQLNNQLLFVTIKIDNKL
jgi:hypothetical protein